MRSEKKLHMISLMSGAFVIFVAFWAFGLGNSIFNPGDNHNASGQWYVKPLEDFHFSDDFPEVHESENDSASVNESTELSPESTQEAPHTSVIIPKATSVNRVIDEPKLTMNDLEKRQFVFEANGEMYQVSSQKKSTSMNLVLKPVPGTSLKQFQIVSGKLVMDTHGIPITGGILSVDDNGTTIDLSGGTGLTPVGTISGTSGGLLFTDSDHNVPVSFSKQQLFLSDNDSIPYYVSIHGQVKLG